MSYDAIVIGSGIGGLACAGLLAGVGGKKVLVLEKHTEPGGLTHVFRRDGASWDVGVHYVGEMQPGSQARRLMDYLSGGSLSWRRLPERFERFVYPDMDIRLPGDPAGQRRALEARFPAERRAIRRYFRDVRRIRSWWTLGFMRDMVPSGLAPAVSLLRRRMDALALMTTAEYLRMRFRSSALRALVASQWGDYGLPPEKSAFAIHAQIVYHYLHGAWFPEGGAGRIARTFEPRIEASGGAVLVGQDVRRILFEEGRACGVEVIDHRGPEPRRVVYRAPVIVSGAGAHATFGHLIAGEDAKLAAVQKARLDGLVAPLSAVTVYLRLSRPVASIGLEGENLWINTDQDHDDLEGGVRDLLNGQPRRAYVSFPSAKSGEGRFHTAEIIGFVDPAAFTAWRDRPKGARGADYSALKDRLAKGLLALAETAAPGLSGLVTYSEVSTPLSVEHYTSHRAGGFYGLAATPERLRSDVFRPGTGIPGLFLAGQDAGCLGVVGALMGGVGAACQVLGPRAYPSIQAALRKTPVAPPPAIPAHRTRGRVAAKSRRGQGVWNLEIELDQPLLDFRPGQFVRLRVGDWEWRDYSVAGLEGGRLRLLISTRTGGEGSRRADALQVGQAVEFEGPMGAYTLSGEARDRVFIATGTGLAPFLAMFAELARRGELDSATLLFGARTSSEDLTRGELGLPARVIRCLSREPAAGEAVPGRVTDALADLEFDPEETEFYVCGSAVMVADVRGRLETMGAQRIRIEAF